MLCGDLEVPGAQPAASGGGRTSAVSGWDEQAPAWAVRGISSG